MTLLQLLKQIRHIEEHLTATEGIPLKKGIPLKMYGYDIDIILGVQQDDNGDYCVNVEYNRGFTISVLHKETSRDLVDAAYEMVCWLLENNLIKKGGQDE